MSRTVAFDVSTVLIERALQLPLGVHIESVSTRWESGVPVVEVTVWSPTFPEGHHKSSPILTEHQVEWDWNLETEEAS